MPSSIEALKGRLQKLITKFQADREYYLSSEYLEAQARVDFVTAFFGSGTDIRHFCSLHSILRVRHRHSTFLLAVMTLQGG
ncbi:MAG: hypothetical protein LAO31_11460 [Acidobacteriia bacterium]|nr:hypothetical protein [Terriglobia bacterium]